jgi:uncharacterized protein YciI
MPLFHFLGLDKPGALQLRIDTRPAHIAYVKNFVRLGGPLLDDAGQPMGSAMILEAESLEDARTKLAADPYAKAGLFRATELRPWRLSIGTLPGYDG